MTALAEIQSAIRQEGPVPPGYVRSVLVGESAARALKAAAYSAGDDAVVPPAIMGTPVVETTQFPGWALVERPLPASLMKRGK